MLKLVGRDITAQVDPEQKICISSFYQALNHGELKYKARSCLCGSKDSLKTIIKKDRYGILSPLNVCKRCSLPYVSIFLDENSLSKFYQYYYRPMYSESYRTPEFIYNAQLSKGKGYASYLSNLGIVLESSKVVDIGCGPGGVLDAFDKNKNNCFGCDFDLNFMEYGRENGKVIYFGDFFDVEESQKVDLVIMSHVLEHISDPIEYLYKLHSRLNEGGLLLLEVPGLMHLHEGVVGRFFQGVHLYTFYEDYLKVIVESLGFKVISSDEGITMLCMKNDTPMQPSNVRKKLDSLGYRANGNQAYIDSTVRAYNLGLNPWMYRRLLKKGIVSLLTMLKLKDFIKNIIGK